MMNIGDLFRKAACYADELCVRAAGRLMTHQKSGKIFRAVYSLPYGDSNKWGIGDPDEITVEVGYNDLLKKIGIPAIADIFIDCRGDRWQLITRQRKDNFILGENRLILTMSRYQESQTQG